MLAKLQLAISHHGHLGHCIMLCSVYFSAFTTIQHYCVAEMKSQLAGLGLKVHRGVWKIENGLGLELKSWS